MGRLRRTKRYFQGNKDVLRRKKEKELRAYWEIMKHSAKGRRYNGWYEVVCSVRKDNGKGDGYWTTKDKTKDCRKQ